MKSNWKILLTAIIGGAALALIANLNSQEDEPAKAKKKAKKKAQQLPVQEPIASLNQPGVHEDFPTTCFDADGNPVIAYIEHDGEADALKIANLDENGISAAETISADGVDNIYQPGLALLPDGEVLCVWSQLEKDGQWDLVARTPGGEIFPLTEGAGNDIFPDVGVDRKGRVWVTWQRMENGSCRILMRNRDPESGEWSEEFTVAIAEAGDWEPRLAFGAEDEALIVFDSYRNGDFDVFLTRVRPDGAIRPTIEIAATDRYEARAEAACSPDGKTLWVVYENGIKLWGKDLGADWRKKGGGLHHDRLLKVVKVDLENNSVEKVADLTDLLPDLVADPQSVGTGAIDVPEIVVDADGKPWVFFRYVLFNSPGFWQIAYSRLDPETEEWTAPEVLGNSSFCLDRRTSVALNSKDGTLNVVYPSDLRKNKQAGDTGIYFAKIDTQAERKSAGKKPFDLAQKPPTQLRPYNDTPERDLDDHHVWKINGEEYELFWGDVHRHTDFSNCRTTDDGCIVEHFRYAIEAGGLDYLGTSDHTEVGKRYTAYEWWQTQKLADLFHNPGSFVSLYAYEREQKFPYGHRNVLFIERGGPLIYIKRKNYAEAPWAKPLPEPEGEILGDIPPWQLWDLLRAHGKRAITIEHTSAGGMGTDWSKYPGPVDPEFENIIELFQGSRESFEGEGAPQPPIVVGGEKVSTFKGNSATGTWQKALAQNHRLGAFASSDHRSTNISYGGVYVKKLDREGIFEAMDARRTTAATDKIFMEFSCNGHLMGEAFETAESPAFEIRINGTAPIKRVTLIKNEEDFQVFEPESKSNEFSRDFTDDSAAAGENRYYVRVEQVDGNMGWTSPVWVQFRN